MMLNRIHKDEVCDATQVLSRNLCW